MIYKNVDKNADHFSKQILGIFGKVVRNENHRQIMLSVNSLCFRNSKIHFGERPMSILIQYIKMGRQTFRVVNQQLSNTHLSTYGKQTSHEHQFLSNLILSI